MADRLDDRGERLGGVSMNVHALPSRLAAAREAASEREPRLSAISSSPALVPEREEPCGSASIKSVGRDGFATWAARWAASVLFPVPPFRDANTKTFMWSPRIVRRFTSAITGLRSVNHLAAASTLQRSETTRKHA